MTREELLEKRRVGFEEYIRYRYVLLNNKTWTDEEIWDRFGAEWLLWNAALDSVEIEFPVPFEADDFYMYDGDEMKAELEKHGLKVKS